MNSRKKILIGSIGFLLLLLLVVIPLYHVYILQARDSFTRNWLGFLPAASIEGEKLSYHDYLEHVEAQETFLRSPMAANMTSSTTPAQISHEAMQRALRITLITHWAKQEGIQVNQSEVDQSFQALVDRAGTSTQPGEVARIMQELFGWDEVEFKQRMIQPALLEDQLAQRYIAQGKTDADFQLEIDRRLATAKIYVGN